MNATGRSEEQVEGNERVRIRWERVFAAASLLFLAICCSPPMYDWVPPIPCPKPGDPMVVVGDTQRTSWPEEVFLGREQNERARVDLIHQIVAEKPAFVVHLGNLVAAGGDAGEWEYFDRLVSPLTARSIRIMPTPGNHEYWGNEDVAARELRSRFPELGHGTFYTMRYRGLGLVWLNTNLGGEEADDQSRWFEERLQVFERDPTIRGVLVFTHHPPFTRGKHRSGEEYVKSDIVPRFESFSKAKVLMSGHVHGYERFEQNGKIYVVTGGGGGPRVEYSIDDSAHPIQKYRPPTGDPRAFNYVVIRFEPAQLVFTARCIATPSDSPWIVPVPPDKVSATPHAFFRDVRPPRIPLCEGGVLDTFTVPLTPLSSNDPRQSLAAPPSAISPTRTGRAP